MNENSAKPAEDNYALQSGGAADEIEKLKKIPEVSMAIEHYKKYKNERIQLLLAIKPFLGEERKEKADAVISFLRILELLDSAAKKKRQFSSEDCRFFLVLFSLFVLLSSLKENCRFQIKDKREK